MTRQVIIDRLQQLADANDGRLTPDMVVKDALAKTSPLHAEFNWDVKEAARAHWLDQARRLIANVEIVIRTSKMDIRAPGYVRDPSVAGNRQGYVSVDRLRSNEDQAREALIGEFQRVASMLARARTLAAALDLVDDVDRIINGVSDLRSRVSQQPAAIM